MPMTLSAFADRAQPPAEPALAGVLGAAWPLWTDLLARLRADLPDLAQEWRYGGKTVGWGLRVTQGTRAVLSLIPGEGSFLASLALGERAVLAARERGLPDGVLAVVDAAPRYAEGRGVRLPVSTAEDVAAALELVAAKLAR